MERLTLKKYGEFLIKNNDGEYRSPCFGCESINKCNPEKTACGFFMALKKLEEYEDLEEENKLPKLPCAVGDTVYRINKGAEKPIIPLQVMNFKIFNNDLVESFKMECVDEWDGAYVYRKTDIGRSVFLTKESAEAALKEISE